MSAKTVAQKACACAGTSPAACIDDEEFVTQWVVRPKPFKNAPGEEDRDRAVSVVRGALAPADAFEAVVGKRPVGNVLANLEARVGRVADIRACPLAVVHTPGRFPLSLHTSVVHPDRDPLTLQEVDWPADLRIGFDRSFEYGEDEPRGTPGEGGSRVAADTDRD